MFLRGLPQQLDPRAGGLPVQPILHVGAAQHARVTLADPVDQGLCLAQVPQAQVALVGHLRRDPVQAADGSHTFEVAPLAGDHRARRPVPIRVEARQPPQLGHRSLSLRDGAAVCDLQDLDLAVSDRVALGPPTTGGGLGALPIDPDRMVGFHPVACRADHRVGGVDDVTGRAVVVDQEGRPGVVVLFEAADELHRGPVERVDVLVVVADGEQAEAGVLLGEGSAGQCGDEVVLIAGDVLILVDEYPPEPRQQARPGLLGFFGFEPLAAQQGGRLPEDLSEPLVEVCVGLPVRLAREAGADEPHGEGVAGEHHHAACVVAYQVLQPAADLDGGVAVVGQRQDASGVLAPGTNQIGDAMHEHPGLARAGPGEHQHVRGLAVVCYQVALVGVVEALDDLGPRFGRGLAVMLGVATVRL